MIRYSIVFLCAVLVISNVEYIQAGKLGGGGSRSGGYSGGGHSYPRSSGGSHSYPGSTGLSGNSGRGGGSHSYPNSGGSGSHSYPNSGHSYPNSGNSGSHTYPNSGGGLSGTNNHGSTGRGNQGTTQIHNHYHYNPPQQIHYASPHGGPAVSYPVYRGTPPAYVYQYKNSGSKYGTLLTGLALLNLGALAGGAIGYSAASSGHSHSNNYRPQPNEICLFGVKKPNGDYEETKIECQLISSFIYADQAKQQNSQNPTNTVVTTVTNTTIVNTTNVQDTPPVYVLSPNGTAIPVPPASVPDSANATSGAPATGGTVTSSVSITTINTTTANAVDVKGPAVQVTAGMQCYVTRRTPTSRMKHEVPCGLLQTYADKSLKPNSASRNVPAFTILAVVCAVFVNNYELAIP